MGLELWKNSVQQAEFIVMLILSPLGVFLSIARLVVVKRGERQIKLEDGLSVTAALLFVLFNVSSMMGRLLSSLWDMTALYIYFFQSLTVKLSILALYHRIFGVERVYRLWIYGLALIQSVMTIIFCIFQALQCKPFDKYFDLNIPGSCIDEGLVIVGGETPNLLVDFAMVALVMFMIRPRQLPSITKWKLRVLFGLGSFVGVIGFIKIAVTYSSSSIYAFSLVALWTSVQMFVSLLCCCLPILHQPLSNMGLWSRLGSKLASFTGSTRRATTTSASLQATDMHTGSAAYASAHASGEYNESLNVVRIAPNELVFASPQALTDIYGSHTKNMEHFAKTQINNHGGDKHGGLIWEWDPVRHRKVSKQLSPAFSGRALKAKEAILHRYTDLFVQRMKEFGGGQEGVSLPTWINWLCVDISADMAYNREMNALKDMKDPPYLSILAGLNKAVVVIQMSWRFPLLSPLKYIFLLFALIRPHSDIRDHSRQQLERRIRRKGAVEHVDFFEQIIPDDKEPPRDKQEMRHLEQVAGQLLIAGYEPPALWLYQTFYHLLKNPDKLRTLTVEIRGAFDQYDSITATAAAELPYLSACLKETLRLMPALLTGMPVVSPGAVVDGTFIPKGVVCQSGHFALARSTQNFHEAQHFRPERWLPQNHLLRQPCYDHDKRDGFHPFSQGPRMCTGREIAWWESRVAVAKTVWALDLALVSGHDMDMDRDMRGWGMFVKPEIRVRFVPAE
ncbi:benzoate 4-monooxygenase cytochrome P450 [Coniella lustricola]|uniref:Benzoate 4-monooxygenase cytochrome P450 n=1 Tax=Coniella lustricola TaxID=2025994 RepID=A0A2T3A0J8_9PEZI|nr:benzoate 4-monooxygenase cytochrome P450 [Coniella lustricola]